VEPWIELARRAWPGLEVEPGAFGTGLINDTRRARLGADLVVLQRVHPAFAPRVHVDIEAVTSHLASKGQVTPRLVRTAAGELCGVADDGRAVRVLTFVEGESHDKLRTPAMASRAGALVARFHAALADLEHDYVHVRPGIHDLPFRVAGLERALEAHRGHRLYEPAARLRDAMTSARDLLGASPTRPRHAHGDLKASNLLFDAHGDGVCLVDLDTVASMSWPFELGDALRSWCNPAGEDVESPKVDVATFVAAVDGYAGALGGLTLEPLETELLVSGVRTIAAELAVRFLTDALEERYFGFDAARFPARGEHNLLRAHGQWALAESLGAARTALEDATRAAFSRRS
jgi:Ser/Thr protein kinase RdoA (MazF antagonist)